MDGERGRRKPSRGDRPFGRHVKALRRARGLTQEDLAERSGLSTDTIRRLERGSFSPSMDTIGKLCRGLALTRSTLFAGYELGERELSLELVDAIAGLSDAEKDLALNLIEAIREYGIEQMGSDTCR